MCVCVAIVDVTSFFVFVVLLYFNSNSLTRHDSTYRKFIVNYFNNNNYYLFIYNYYLKAV